MKEGQDKIFFVTGEGQKAAEISPAMEEMKQLDHEVLYMVDPLDEICGQSIADFMGKKLVTSTKQGSTLPKSDGEKKAVEVVRDALGRTSSIDIAPISRGLKMDAARGDDEEGKMLSGLWVIP